MMNIRLALAFAVVVYIVGSVSAGLIKTTAQRIASYNYPVETHKVLTSDGYVLTMFRIPYSPKLRNQNTPKPVVFLQHGLLGSSDSFILNGPDNALAFLLADAGFDCWIGNNRGNTYSKLHVKFSTLLPQFWDFSWNEIALFDMPAMIDYALCHTNQKALHYVGHSQGTTVFFVLMSELPLYNAKIKTAHMLAPVVYTENIQIPVVKVLGPLLGKPNVINELIGNMEFRPNRQMKTMMGSQACKAQRNSHPMCDNTMFLSIGWDSDHINKTLLPDAMETHPAGASTGQLIHYLQEYNSGKWRKYDFGLLGNFGKYSQWSPPNYTEKNVVAPVRLYYSDNDMLADITDVYKLISLLPNVVRSFHVPYPTFNHLDFLWALEVKELLYDRIIRAANRFERTGKP